MFTCFQWLVVLLSIVAVTSVSVHLKSSTKFIKDTHNYSKDLVERKIVKRATDEDDPFEEINTGPRSPELNLTRVEPGQRHPACDYNPTQEMSTRLKSITNTNLRRVSDIQCEIYAWEYKIKVVEDERHKDICINNTENQATVYGGASATQGRFPHMGAIGWRSGTKYKFMCGCSLISYKHALTAAHCKSSSESTPPEPEVVRFGTVNLMENYTYDEYVIDRILILDKYKRNVVAYNDIGLVVLKTEVSISVNLRPACLYFKFSEMDIQKGYITGWGGTKKDEYSTSLQFAEVDIMDRKMCDDNYRFKSITNWHSLHNSQFCAGNINGSKDTCSGDSGGPIQLERKFPRSIDPDGVLNQYYVFGVTSGGASCGTKDYPGIYNKVYDENFLCWIEKKVWPDEENNFCSENYSFDGYDVIS